MFRVHAKVNCHLVLISVPLMCACHFLPRSTFWVHVLPSFFFFFYICRIKNVWQICACFWLCLVIPPVKHLPRKKGFFCPCDDKFFQLHSKPSIQINQFDHFMYSFFFFLFTQDCENKSMDMPWKWQKCYTLTRDSLNVYQVFKCEASSNVTGK